MKKILVFGITDKSGGVEAVIMNYYRFIDRSKIQFEFLCNTDEVAYEDEIKKLGGVIYRITARSKDRKKYHEDMTKFFEEHAKDYEAIWVNVCSLANIDYLKYAKKYGIKKRIIHSHNSQNMDSKLRGILHRINKLFISKYATDFWSCGDEAGKWFYSNKIINSDKYLFVNNAIDTDKYKYDEKTRKEYRKKMNLEDKIVFGNVGRFHFQKNHTFMIKVFNEFQKEKPNSVLLLIGQGEDEEKIKNQIKEYGLEDKIIILGVRNDVDKLMQCMDVFLFPSLFEGLPLVLVEAQTAKLLIFASDVITKGVKFNDRLYYLSLEKDEKYWAKRILERLDKIEDRKSDVSDIVKNGFDIKNEAKKIEKLL